MNGNSKDLVWNERWHLAVLTQQDFVKIGLTSIIVGLAFIVFHLQGNTTDIRMFGRSAILWMIHRWSDSGGDFSHGALIPLVSLGVLWYRRREIAACPKQVNRAGLYVVIVALLFHWLGAKAQQTRLSLLGLILLMWGVPFYFYGWELAKRIMFPCAYLIFCIPLNFLDSMTFRLRMMATVVSCSLLNGLGVAVERVGSGIHSLSGGGFKFDVADPCSGLRSLLAMTALTAVYAYLTQKTLIKKWILFLCSIPLAIIGNMARITSIGLVAEAFGENFALKLYHDYSGYVVLSVAIGLMVALGGLLNLNYGEVWKRWKLALLSPTSS